MGDPTRRARRSRDCRARDETIRSLTAIGCGRFHFLAGFDDAALPFRQKHSVDGLLLATGHFRNGIMLAPITADAVVATLAGEPVPTSMTLADPNRLSLVAHRATKDNGLAGEHALEAAR